MKKDIHPECHNITVRCFCGNSFETTSTSNKIDIDICSHCHPFFTGTQKFVDTAGRIEKFQRRYTTDSSKKETKVAEKKVATETQTQTKTVEPKAASQEPKPSTKKAKKSK